MATKEESQPVAPQDKRQPMIPGLGGFKTTMWLQRNIESVNPRIWSSHFELSRYRFYDISFLTNSNYHMPYLPLYTRRYLQSSRFLNLSFYGPGPFLLHCPPSKEELNTIIDKIQRIYNKQIQSNGDITPEFRNYVLRQVARTTPGRNAFDIARIYSDYAKQLMDDPPNAIIARRYSPDTIEGIPNYKMKEYFINANRETKGYLNDDQLFLCNSQNFGVFDIKTGNYAMYEEKDIEFIQPIKTGGFLFAKRSGTIYCAKEIRKISPPIETTLQISKFVASGGAQLTFAASDVSSSVLSYGSLNGVKNIIVGNISLFDVYNHNVYVVTDGSEVSVKHYLDGRLAREWRAQETISCIKYVPQQKFVGLISTSGFSGNDERMKDSQFYIEQKEAFDFSFNESGQLLCLSTTKGLTVYDQRMIRPIMVAEFGMPMAFQAKWMRNADNIAVISQIGRFSVLNPMLTSPVMESYICGVSETVSIDTSYNTVLLKQENGYRIMTSEREQLFVPTDL